MDFNKDNTKIIIIIYLFTLHLNNSSSTEHYKNISLGGTIETDSIKYKINSINF